MTRRADITVMADGVTPQPGVYVTVKAAGGALAAITTDAGAAIAGSTVLSGLDGSFYYNAPDGSYTEEYRLTALGSVRKVLAVTLNSTLDIATAAASSAVATVSGSLATGVFFDTAAGDTFTGTKFRAASGAGLTVNASTLVFNSTPAVTLDSFVQNADGTKLLNAFDAFDIDATYTITSFPAAGVEGVLTGTRRDMSGTAYYGSMLSSGGAGAGYAIAQTYNATAALATGSQFAFAAPISVRERYRVRGTSASTITGYPATADETIGITQVYTATSYEAPRLFAELGVGFRRGVITCTALKVSAAYPNAQFALVGDSLFQGRFVTNYGYSLGGQLRSLYPNDVIVAAAPSATTADWLDATTPVIAMKPKNAFICLGVNDILLALDDASIKANLTTIVGRFKAAGIRPIVLSIPPINSSRVPPLNAWIAAQGWLYVDIYSLLVGAGYAISSIYNTANPDGSGGAGDTVHWNNLAEDVVASAILDCIEANDLGFPVVRGNFLPSPPQTGEISVNQMHGTSEVPGTVATTNNRLDLGLYHPANTFTASSIEIEVSAAAPAGKRAKICIYADAAGSPGTLLASSGHLAVDTTGVKTWTAAFKFRRNVRYWIGVHSEDVFTYYSPALRHTRAIGYDKVNHNHTIVYRVSSAYGTPPASGTGGTPTAAVPALCIFTAA